MLSFEQALPSTPLLSVKDVKTHYTAKRGLFQRSSQVVKAVDGVSFELMEGEVLGLVGESGCGKSTLGRTIIGLEPITSGTILYRGQDIRQMSKLQLSREVQIVFQDPYSSLNPRKTVGALLREPLFVHAIVPKHEIDKEVNRLLDLVGLPKASKERYPHQFSGGQRQRVGIARALSLKPKLLICDEPVSALDVSIQAQILNLFKDLQQELSLTYLFIAHGLGAVKYVSNRIAVMKSGQIVEINTKDHIFQQPQHPYTQTLLNAYPVPDPKKRHITVDV